MRGEFERGDARIRQHIGAIIKLHRDRAGWSQDALAAAVDIDRSMVSKIESGTTCCAVDTLYLLTKALRINPQLYFEIHEESPFEDNRAGKEDLMAQIRSLTPSPETADARKAILDNLDLFGSDEIKAFLIQLVTNSDTDAA